MTMKKKTTKKKPKWEMTDRGNYMITFKGFHVSYNPCTASFLGFCAGYEETALVIEDEKAPFGFSFAILNGDFRKQYEKCKTLKEALTVFKKNKKHISTFSTYNI